MSKLLRGVAAGYGARKLTGGCGCMGIIVFIILWYILGHFGIFVTSYPKTPIKWIG